MSSPGVFSDLIRTISDLPNVIVLPLMDEVFMEICDITSTRHALTPGANQHTATGLHNPRQVGERGDSGKQLRDELFHRQPFMPAGGELSAREQFRKLRFANDFMHRGAALPEGVRGEQRIIVVTARARHRRREVVA